MCVFNLHLLRLTWLEVVLGLARGVDPPESRAHRRHHELGCALFLPRRAVYHARHHDPVTRGERASELSHVGGGGRGRGVGAQAQKQGGFRLKALLSFSQSNFENWGAFKPGSSLHRPTEARTEAPPAPLEAATLSAPPRAVGKAKKLLGAITPIVAAQAKRKRSGEATSPGCRGGAG